ncbi:hypothetical protein KSF_074160 [Reticulibacter mediterranei]|uniref:Uncharacterized protein n=1 Tax=Reticulibacter mediterranei TaxID=2778369 RepID=A0A8J3INQ2_9CHLR|nr:hypothetical protein [Reticulibacter mediterranei]GHO97368.1 hypothetical protein KSF_074160 [Reticulibacter mediterranei]
MQLSSDEKSRLSIFLALEEAPCCSKESRPALERIEQEHAVALTSDHEETFRPSLGACDSSETTEKGTARASYL